MKKLVISDLPEGEMKKALTRQFAEEEIGEVCDEELTEDEKTLVLSVVQTLDWERINADYRPGGKNQDAATDGKDLRCLNAMGKVRAETASRLTLR